MMRRITLSDGTEWGCETTKDRSGGHHAGGNGVFSRRRDGTWQQHTGTCQTPRFSSPEQFRRYLAGRYVDVGVGLRVVATSW